MEHVLWLAVITAAAVFRLLRMAAGPPGLASWREVGEAVGLTDLEVSRTLGFETGLSGRAGPLRVRVSEWQDGTRVVIGGLRHRSHDLWFRREDSGTAFEKQLGTREIVLGDDAFDDVVYLQGSPAVARAVFDAETRLLVLRLIQGRIGATATAVSQSLAGQVLLADGELQVALPGTPLSRAPDMLREALPPLLAIARRLVRPSDVAARLADNLRQDPVASVRHECLLERIREYPGAPATRDALRSALGDRDEELRFRAALALGDEGRAVLVELASREDADDGRAARAIARLGTFLSAEQAMAILDRALRRRRVASALACLETLPRLGGGEVAARLAKVLRVEGGDVAEAAARALGATEDAAAEAPLVEALARGGGGLRVAAAEALGRVGTAAAVAPLREAAERRGADRALRRATRQAIAGIQSRLVGAAPGQISLAEPEAGQLSLAGQDDAAGALSLSDTGPRLRGGGDPAGDGDGSDRADDPADGAAS